MVRNVAKSLTLLFFSVVICCILYPLLLWLIGQTIFAFQANGSLLKGPDGKVVGSRLIAQPFTKDEYFQPRPSAASYDGSASASSSLAPSNYALRDRVARAIGPLATYRDGPKAGRPAAPDVEQWFGRDMFRGSPHIVAQWARLHPSLARAWVNASPVNRAFVDDWAKAHQALVSKWVKDNPAFARPKAPDLAVAFFEDFSRQYPGRFPSPVTRKGADGKDRITMEPVKEGPHIQSIFFDMWRQEHPDASLQEIPGDLVTASASGLDPHITLQNARFQLDRVAAKWAANMKRDKASIMSEIERVLGENSSAPLWGLAGERVINVLEVNLELVKRYGKPIIARK